MEDRELLIQMQNEMSELKSQLQLVDNELSSSKQARKKVYQLEQQMSILEERFCENKKTVDELKQQIKDLERQITELEKTITKELSSLGSDLSSKISALEVRPALQTSEIVKKVVGVAAGVIITALVTYIMTSAHLFGL